MNENETTPTVYLVDDDASVRSALTRALNAEGFHVMSWASADAFLADYDPEKPGCLVADVAMPGTDGLQLQSLLSASDRVAAHRVHHRQCQRAHERAGHARRRGHFPAKAGAPLGTGRRGARRPGARPRRCGSDAPRAPRSSRDSRP